MSRVLPIEQPTGTARRQPSPQARALSVRLAPGRPRSRLGSLRWGRTLICGLILLRVVLSLPAGEPPVDLTFSGIDLPTDRLMRAEQLARIYCVSCHLFPEPDLLDRNTWLNQTLRRMKIRVGLSPAELELSAEAALIKATGVIPNPPAIPPEAWNEIVDYYAAKAPAEPLPQAPRPRIEVGLKFFRAERPQYRRPSPSTTLVQISRFGGAIFMGDDQAKVLDLLRPDGRLKSTIAVGNVPVGLVETDKGIYLSSIGSFMPSEKALGEFTFFERSETGFKPGQVILKNLPRPTSADFGDFNEDGRDDFVMGMFGNLVGRLAWFENQGADRYLEHVLLPKPGAVRVVAADLNSDHHLDIAVLIAQEIETFFIFLNDGKGNFQGKTIFQTPPVYGHTYFDLIDFNHDGRTDILTTNGDNGEYPSPLKRYHGIRIYLNQGDLAFTESFFFPLNGAFKAMARDFDEDSDLDIAAISFFPDFISSPRESFVFLENTGDFNFKPTTFRECIGGRWLTMDAADLDGDKDLDIVLGAFIHGPSDVPDFLMTAWEKAAPSVKILTNTLR